MRIISRKRLIDFWRCHPDAEQALRTWFKEAQQAEWRTPQAVKAHYGNASILQGGRVVFNVAGNKYRLVVMINYAYGVIYIRFVGTHAQYDSIDAAKI